MTRAGLTLGETMPLGRQSVRITWISDSHHDDRKEIGRHAAGKSRLVAIESFHLPDAKPKTGSLQRQKRDRLARVVPRALIQRPRQSQPGARRDEHEQWRVLRPRRI